ncbi:putative 60S ribosomal protein L4 [Blattamonas nauphoetae]|uniref:B-related factor 1 n=1 Tax=Blattamonas nauphoetae TaxID=2049346 RepID=A0ABQ9XLH1_9EUKA|nr:putative 60S ribosomal protein L4 [Blattamonas nauphoetae]
MPTCPNCGGTEVEKDPTRGISSCIHCGAVVEDNSMVSEVSFIEKSSGASAVVGQFVSTLGYGSASSKPGMKSSRDITIAKAQRRITQIAGSVGMQPRQVESAVRLFVLALSQNFVKGRRAELVYATCLYIICRRESSPHLLLDFADVMQTSIYSLGNYYMLFCRAFGLRLPVVDPSLFLHRFAAALEFGDRTHEVYMTSLRLVQRMQRDWITTGRSPASVCGAALLIAAHIHNFRRTVQEVVSVVRVCNSTLQERLADFGETQASSLSYEEILDDKNNDNEEADPPAFRRLKIKEAMQKLEEENAKSDKLKTMLIPSTELEGREEASTDTEYIIGLNEQIEWESVVKRRIAKQRKRKTKNEKKPKIKRTIEADDNDEEEEEDESFDDDVVEVIRETKIIQQANQPTTSRIVPVSMEDEISEKMNMSSLTPGQSSDMIPATNGLTQVSIELQGEQIAREMEERMNDTKLMEALSEFGEDKKKELLNLWEEDKRQRIEHDAQIEKEEMMRDETEQSKLEERQAKSGFSQITNENLVPSFEDEEDEELPPREEVVGEQRMKVDSFFNLSPNDWKQSQATPLKLPDTQPLTDPLLEPKREKGIAFEDEEEPVEYVPKDEENPAVWTDFPDEVIEMSLCTAEEAKIKEEIWDEMFLDFLQEQLKKREEKRQKLEEQKDKHRQRPRAKRELPKPLGEDATAADHAAYSSVGVLQRKLSSKINTDVLSRMFNIQPEEDNGESAFFDRKEFKKKHENLDGAGVGRQYDEDDEPRERPLSASRFGNVRSPFAGGHPHPELQGQFRLEGLRPLFTHNRPFLHFLNNLRKKSNMKIQSSFMNNKSKIPSLDLIKPAPVKGTSMPVTTVFGKDGNPAGTVHVPSVIRNAPIRPDVVHFVHTNLAKNDRQPYGRFLKAGHQHSAESWGTGRAVARLPRISGSGTSANGSGAFANCARGGHMYAPLKIWRRWHRMVNVNEKRYAVSSAIAATAVPALVQARGHCIDNVPEIPLVVSDDIEQIKKTKEAVAILRAIHADDDVKHSADSRKIRAGTGKMRNRRYVQRRGVLFIHDKSEGATRAFRNISGVEIANVNHLNLLDLAPGGHLGRFVIWTESAFKKLDALYGTKNRDAVLKKRAGSGYRHPRAVMTTTDLGSIINSAEVQRFNQETKPGVPKIPFLRKDLLLVRKRNPNTVLTSDAKKQRRAELAKLRKEKGLPEKKPKGAAKRKHMDVWGKNELKRVRVPHKDQKAAAKARQKVWREERKQAKAAKKLSAKKE